MSQQPPTTTAQNIPNNKTWIWEGLKISFPIVTAAFTAIFGFFIWNAQNGIQRDVDQNRILLQSQIQAQQSQLQAQLEIQQAQLRMQLALKEEFFKRRFNIYETMCKQVADTESSLAALDGEPETTMRALDLVNNLYKDTRSNRLYWGEHLERDLQQLWLLATCKIKSEECELGPNEVRPPEALPEEITKTVVNVHEHMKKDLDISELAKFFSRSN